VGEACWRSGGGEWIAAVNARAVTAVDEGVGLRLKAAADHGICGSRSVELPPPAQTNIYIYIYIILKIGTLSLILSFSLTPTHTHTISLSLSLFLSLFLVLSAL